MKFMSVIGARPQFIKAAAVSRAILKNKNIRINEVIVHTGQHYDQNMSEIFFAEMQIPKPNYSLGINRLSHGAMTGRMLEKIEKVLLKERPDIVIVYGDTNSTLAGALAAAKMQIPVAHVESGLRSFNRRMPEEINRVLTDRISTFLFCPTKQAINNLENEGIVSNKYLIGDVMFDSALFYAGQSRQHSAIIKNLESTLPGLNNFILCTVHRAENTDDPDRLRSIFSALERISHEIPIILPLHPRTRNRMKSLEMKFLNMIPGIIDPVSYFDTIELLKKCSLVMTDSGGLQKEAFFFKKPCVTLRNETEWIELVEHDCNTLAGCNKENIYQAYCTMKNKKIDNSIEIYGNGHASDNIVAILTSQAPGIN